MFICNVINNPNRKDLVKFIKDPSFFDFVQSNEKDLLKSNIKSSKEDLKVTTRMKGDFEIQLDQTFDQLVPTIIDFAKKDKKNLKISYQIYLLQLSFQGQLIDIFKTDVGIPFFKPFFEQKGRFSVNFNDSIFQINQLNLIKTQEIELNSKEIAQMEIILKIKRFQSVLLSLFLIIETMKKSKYQISFYFPDGQKISKNLIAEIIKQRLFREIYQVLY